MRLPIAAGSLLIAGVFLPAVALAHTQTCVPGFTAGFFHPLTGVDHLLAMAAVGWWSAIVRSRHWWAIPVSFAVAVLAGALIGASGAIAIAGAETMVALSLVVLGALLAFSIRLSTPLACVVAGVLALSHGYVHGVELPLCHSGYGWLVGMMAATLLLHMAGALAGLTVAGRRFDVSRLAGVTTAVVGSVLLAMPVLV